MVRVTLPDGVELRLARPDEAEAVARLHIACWREAYGPIAAPGLLAAHLADEAGRRDRWRSQIEAGQAPLIAVVADEAVGFVKVGASQAVDAPTPLTLYALYVRAAWHGSGIGNALFEAGLGDRAAHLWVLEDNARARAFYDRRGFRPEGTRKKYVPLDVWELQLVRTDSVPAPSTG